MALTTRGSIDWVAFSKSTINFSVEFLARFSRAGVEALAIAVGQALFSQFDVPADAQMRLHNSVSQLKAFSSASDLLWLGVGFKHPMRMLLDTEQGCSLVAVSACLMVSYKNTYAAAVLKSLCHRSSLPDNLTPSLSQWGAMADLCAPSVLASKFPVLVEGFSRLLIKKSVIRMPDNVLATTPDELAIALLELAPLSRGQAASITMVGKADCAWLAALAVWLFSLRVEIVDQEGKALYQTQDTTFPASNSFQLTIIRLEDDQSSIPKALTRSRTHLVTPGDLSFKAKTEQSDPFLPGCSEWNTVLQHAFNSSFEKLLESEAIPLFAQLLYSGLHVTNTDPGYFRLNPWGGGLFSEGPEQHQQRFMTMLRFAVARLPELATLEAYARDHILDLEYKEQCREKLPRGVDFERHFGRRKIGIRDKLAGARFSDALVDVCLCPQCEVPDSSASSSLATGSQDRNFLCLSRVSVAIFGLIWQLSWFDIDEKLRPSPHTLRDRLVLALETPAYKIRYMANKNLMRDALALFSGLYQAEWIGTHSAYSRQGICVYLSSLEHPNTDVLGQLRIRVVPGQIEWREKIFAAITENDNHWMRCYPSDPSLERIDGERTMGIIKTLGADASLQIVVEEMLTSATICATLAVIPEGKSQVHWNYLYRPCLGDEVHVEPTSACMLSGPEYLYQSIHHHLEGRNCGNAHSSTKAPPLWNETNSTAPWSGSCTIMNLPWWTHDPEVSGGLRSPLKRDEWILVIVNTEQGTMRVLRCPFGLLYSILARSICDPHRESDTSLHQANDCLVCKKAGNEWETMQLQSLVIDSMVDGRWEHLELQPSLDRIGLGRPPKSENKDKGDRKNQEIKRG